LIRTAIVTGGARGLGRAYVRHLQGLGYRVASVDLLPTDDMSSGQTAGLDALSLRCDITIEADVEQMATSVLDAWGRIDVLINNAAYYRAIEKRPLEELSVEEWDLTFDVNTKGTWLCTKAVVPAMKQARYGRIVNTSSMVVPSGSANFLHYVGSKAAIVGMTRGMATELGPYGITVNTVTPDFIPHDKEYAARVPEVTRMVREARPSGKDQTPEDMLSTIEFLISERSDFVSGQNILVNGGRVYG
jgi:3-oxoacyl-[acyl-carrier protein] reductase